MEPTRFKKKSITMEVLQSQQQRKIRRRRVFYVFVFLLLTALFLTITFTVFFKVREINIEGLNRYTYEELVDVLPFEADQNLYSFSTEDIERILLKEFPYISEVSVTRRIPSRLNINVIETTPVMYIESHGDIYLLSDKLHVLERVDIDDPIKSRLTELKTSRIKRCVVSETAEFFDRRTLEAVITLYANLRENYITSRVKEIDVVARFNISISYENRFKVLLGDMGHIDIKIPFLVGIIKKLGADDTGIIDITDHTEASVSLK